MTPDDGIDRRRFLRGARTADTPAGPDGDHCISSAVVAVLLDRTDLPLGLARVQAAHRRDARAEHPGEGQHPHREPQPVTPQREPQHRPGAGERARPRRGRAGGPGWRRRGRGGHRDAGSRAAVSPVPS